MRKKHAHCSRGERRAIFLLLLFVAVPQATFAADFIITSDGEAICRFTDEGDLIFYSEDENGNPTGGVMDGNEGDLAEDENVQEFIVRRESEILARVDGADGNMYIRGQLYEGVTDLDENPSESELVITSGEDVVALIDEEGNIKLRGHVYPRAVVIDPGHGGQDCGAPSPYNPPESDEFNEEHLTLAFCLDLRDELEALGTGGGSDVTDRVRVILTRTTDENPVYETRGRNADVNNAPYFLSIHFNSQEEPPYTARGIEMLLHEAHATRQVNMTEDEDFADAILPAAWDAYRYYDADATPPVLEPGHTIPTRDTGYDAYRVLKDTDDCFDNTAAHHPISGAILEIDFVTNSAFHELWNVLDAGETSESDGRSPDDVHEDVAEGIANELYALLGLDE